LALNTNQSINCKSIYFSSLP